MNSELKQVGRQCLQSYTGLRSPEMLAQMAEILFDLDSLCSGAEDGGFEGGARSEGLTSVERFLGYVACSIRTTGWMSSTEARKREDGTMSTASHAWNFGLYPARGTDSKYLIAPDEQDLTLAKEVVAFLDEYFEARDPANLSDYEHNLRVTTSSGFFSYRHMGIVASAVKFFKKDLERRARNVDYKVICETSKFVGTPGSRARFNDMLLQSERTWEGDFGVTYFYSFLSPEKNVVVVKVSKPIDVKVGETYDFTGFIKDHNVYVSKKSPELPGCAQTVVNRVKMVVSSTVREVVKVPVMEYKVKPEGYGYSYVDSGKVTFHHICQTDETSPKYVVVLPKASKKLTIGNVVDLEPTNNAIHVEYGIVARLSKAEAA